MSHLPTLVRPTVAQPPAQPPRRRNWWRYALVAPIVVVALAIGSIVGAAQTPGNESLSAKWADWLRSHHAAAIVAPVESFYYGQQAPSKGGRPRSLNPVPAPIPLRRQAAGSQITPTTTASGLPAPAPVPLVVTPGVPGEGHWQPAGPIVGGRPGMYVAQFRADSVYTSQITTAVWIDPTRLRLSLIPGATEPGGTWPTQPPYITAAEIPSAVAAFNGGFRLQDAHGGFYLDGRQQIPLQNGAASVVMYNDGRVDVGVWGTEVTLTPQVTAVLQNLVPIVDHGQPASSATYRDTGVWGATLGSTTVVPRSGLGVSADGALIYVAGPALTARSLAESLQRAGAVRAMTLDINPEWVTFNFYQHTNPAQPSQVTPSKLYPQMQRPANRYLGPTQESRDFFVVSS